MYVHVYGQCHIGTVFTLSINMNDHVPRAYNISPVERRVTWKPKTGSVINVTSYCGSSALASGEGIDTTCCGTVYLSLFGSENYQKHHLKPNADFINLNCVYFLYKVDVKRSRVI